MESHPFWGFACIFYTGMLAAGLIFRYAWVRIQAIYRIRQAKKLLRKYSAK